MCDVDIGPVPSVSHVAPTVIGHRVQVVPGPEAREGGLTVEVVAIAEVATVVVVVAVEVVIARVGPLHEGGLGHASGGEA